MSEAMSAEDRDELMEQLADFLGEKGWVLDSDAETAELLQAVIAESLPAQVVPQPDREAIVKAICGVAENDPDTHDFISPEKAADAVLAALSPAPLTINRDTLCDAIEDNLQNLETSWRGTDENSAERWLDEQPLGLVVGMAADAVIAHLSAQTVSVPEIPDNSAQTVEGEVESPITDEQVEAAAKAVCRAWEGEHPCTNFRVHESHKRVARAALEAAREVQS